MISESDVKEGTEPSPVGVVERRTADSVVRGISAAMNTTMSSGDLADLRRLDSGELAAPAFWKVVVRHIEPAGYLAEAGAARGEAERRWAVIVRTLAILQSGHRENRRLGQALAAAQYSELRLARLLRARGKALGIEVRTAARFLAAKGVPVDGADFARLVLSDEMDYADEVRRDVAHRYFAAQSGVQGRS